MKKLLISLLILMGSYNVYSQRIEHYFKFKESNKDVINQKITRIISIDKIVGDTVYAYANQTELEKFSKLNYKIERLTPPSLINTKVINMATDLSQMSSWNRYPTYNVYRAMMKKFESDYPTLCKLDTIGTTNNGRKLYVVKISSNVLEDESEPEVFLTSTIHGDETTGFIMLLRLADSLLKGYSTDNRIKEIVDNMAIYINPDANPDGTYYYGNSTVSGATRYNANGVDLNRNFPDPRAGDHPDDYSWQVETQAMMDFASKRHFTLSANFHGGAEVANYPWDTWTSSQRTHADNNWFIHTSTQYATFAQTYGFSGYFDEENNGITNGGDWYVITGGRQDYMNWWHHCKEITFEISDTKLLSTDLLPSYWNYNKESLLSYIESANKGFQGNITDEEGNPVEAKVFVTSHDKDSSHVYSNTTTGFYARPIEPGTWTVAYSATGYEPQSHTLTVTDWNTKLVNNVTLVKQKFEVTFEVKNQTTPLASATVNFNNIELQTNSEGKAIFSNFPYGKDYTYTVSLNNYETTSGQVDITDNTTVPINLNPVGVETIENDYSLKVYPNPFSSILNISFEIDKPANVELTLYSIDGKKIATIANGQYPAGPISITWSPKNSYQRELSSGLYLLTLQTSKIKITKLVQHRQ